MAGKRKNGTFLAFHCGPQNTDILAYSCQSIVHKNTAINALYIQLSSVRRYKPAAMITASYHDDDDLLRYFYFRFSGVCYTIRYDSRV